ncbi:MAG: hypothetical protein AAB262_05140 [Elusimicrobiota bacterium]
MNALVLIALEAVFATAAPAPSTPPFPSKGVYWLKTYSTSPHKESWNAELVVKDLDLALPKILKAVEKEGGKLTQPLESFPASRIDHSQQLTLAIPKKGAQALIKRLRKLGELPEPRVSPLGAPIPLNEVRAKIDRLLKEKTERAAAFAQVPVAAEASDEILEHLLMVEAVASRAEVVVLLNLALRGR